MRCTLLQYSICALVVVLTLLQLIQLTMVSWLDNRNPNSILTGAREALPMSDKQNQNQNQTHQQRDKLIHITLPPAKLNTYGSYQIFYDFAKARSRLKSVKRRDITLITHCSMNNLHHVPDLVDRWKGPISLAVFGSLSDVKTIVSYIMSLKECILGVRRNVTFHLVHPVNSVSEEAEIFGSVNNKRSIRVPLIHCSKLMEAIKASYSSVSNYAADGILYPNNLLRNVGRANILTEFHFVLDIDMLPSVGLRENFLNFVKGSSSLWLDEDMVQQMVFVLPAFEMDDRAVSKVPGDKKELLSYLEKDRVRQFYVKACLYCQNHTDYRRWTSLQSFTGQLGVAYTVEWKPMWEPFYISRSDAPLYDERFRQYGYNRISQVCELYMAGFNFAVLDKAFVVHKGFKETTEFHQQKDEENRNNYYLFLQFHTALEYQYPETKRRCIK
ncbi:beta-1,4-glucuronyltransferase 1 [Strongylocentrotus purpuratus]|uniref:Beta-1,4-glucuronyltransferase 1 n=1 Tax=Strongylocentrotus purpuratus TaxID=7668 RepID=A0A7M7RDG3_STRPU|nr:beta-1,4-glucuronyltransferase 1 [Strongylocentrotus purpuratus]XP_782394.1 beta-1,4-glucuronyltransferase 1 [Strongylocentrotus purpuratus]|eukprot:XP_782394.1 PREDICTED: beta-1,4-glucuronyltransferase 1 [Strongylocentrotus purpuratus]